MFSYSVGNNVFLHATDPAVVRDVCLCVSPNDLGKSSYMKITHHPLFGDGILKSNGGASARQRKLIAPEFFPDKVKGMVDLMVGSAQALVRSWEDRVAGSGGGALDGWTSRSTTTSWPTPRRAHPRTENLATSELALSSLGRRL